MHKVLASPEEALESESAYFPVVVPVPFCFSCSVCVRMTSSQSPSDGVGNWQVLVVTTATAGLFSPVRGLIQVTLGDGGSESSLISMVRSSGTETTITSLISVRAAATKRDGFSVPGWLTTNIGVGRKRQNSLVMKKSWRY